MERYSKIKQIGSGTFGQAWLVESTVSKRKYALKELSVSAMSEQDRHLALNEAKILSKLKHKNIVRYKEAFVAQGKLCIAMEFAEKGDLYTRIRDRNGIHFPEIQILEWFTQLCLALKYVHGQNILHRDLKTQNIFLGKDDVIKLGDFGIARMLDSTLDHAQTTVGTPYYLSPEICQRKPYNHKSDIWSLGCVLYEMATLKHAFNANNFSALVIKILQGQYPPIPGQYGPLLEDLVSVLLQKNPDDRPSAKQLLYVPAMQPYVKRFLQCERDRIDSVASDVSETSYRSTHNRSQASSPGKIDKEHSKVNVANESTDSRQGEQHQVNPNRSMKNAQHISYRKQRLSTDRAPRARENEITSGILPKERENIRVTDNASKTQQPLCTNENAPRTRENLRAGHPVDTRKHSLIKLAHALQRRHSEQTSVSSQPIRARISKGRIHSHGAQFRDSHDNEDDVFAVNESTVITARRPDGSHTTKPREIKESVSSTTATRKTKIASVTEERKKEPTILAHQPKSNQDMRTKKRHQSAVTAHYGKRWLIEQKHRRLTSVSGINHGDKENRDSVYTHTQLTARRRVSSGGLRQVQAANTDNRHAVKTTTGKIGQEDETRKNTYTISKERRSSVSEIPDVDERQHWQDENGKDGNGSWKYGNGRDNSRSGCFKDGNSGDKEEENGTCKDGKKCGKGSDKDCNSRDKDGNGIDNDGNGWGKDRNGLRKESEIMSEISKSERCSNPTVEKQTDSRDQKSETVVHIEPKISAIKRSDGKFSMSPCKFTLCGSTLHLENVSSHDSIYSHMEALRMYLEKELGTRLLTAVYHYVTSVSLEEQDRVKKTVRGMLGEDNMKYFPVLLQLVACEAIYFQ